MSDIRNRIPQNDTGQVTVDTSDSSAVAWAGYQVLDSNGAPIGKVDSVWTHGTRAEPAYIGSQTGWLEQHTYFIPATNLQVDDNNRTLRVAFSEDQIKHAPDLGAGDSLTAEDEVILNRYYQVDGITAGAGTAGDWTTGATTTDRDPSRTVTTADTIPLDAETRVPATAAADSNITGPSQTEWDRRPVEASAADRSLPDDKDLYTDSDIPVSPEVSGESHSIAEGQALDQDATAGTAATEEKAWGERIDGSYDNQIGDTDSDRAALDRQPVDRDMDTSTRARDRETASEPPINRERQNVDMDR